MSYVFIWENNILLGGRMSEAKNHNWCGHAAMQLGDDFSPIGTGEHSPENSFVSWVPRKSDSDREMVDPILGYILKSGKGWHQHFAECVKYEKYWPDHVIYLADTNEGLTLAKAKWNEIRTVGDSSYKMLSTNCSKIVERILKAGKFVPEDASTGLLATPNKVRKLAIRAQGQCITDYKEFWPLLEKAHIKWNSFGSGNACVKQVRDGNFATYRPKDGCKFNSGAQYKERDSTIIRGSL